MIRSLLYTLLITLEKFETKAAGTFDIVIQNWPMNPNEKS